jgi:tRNA U34 5-carboxymethylaminomethyl modifying GTPase MnmE/TrmE
MYNKEFEALLEEAFMIGYEDAYNEAKRLCDVEEDPRFARLVAKGNTKEANGLDELKNRIVEMFNLEQINSSDFNYISNARELALVKKAENVVSESINNLNATLPFEIVADDLRISYVALGEIIGETYEEDILDEIFSKFCVGK